MKSGSVSRLYPYPLFFSSSLGRRLGDVQQFFDGGAHALYAFAELADLILAGDTGSR